VGSDFTKCTIERICELIVPRATHLHARYSKFEWQEWTVLFLFLRCEENGTGLPECT
jgi:hypothetical protein